MGMMKAILGDAVDREAYVNHQTLLAAVQTEMFCQVCGSILDIRTAAFVNLGNHPETRRPGGTRTMCAGHLDADTTTGATHDVVTVREHLTREAARLGYTAMEIIDGREFTSRGVYRAAKHRERTEALLAAGTVE